jgi:hypothetical protein
MRASSKNVHALAMRCGFGAQEKTLQQHHSTPITYTTLRRRVGAGRRSLVQLKMAYTGGHYGARGPVQSSSLLRFPEWQPEYEAVLQESEISKLFTCVEVVQAAISHPA